MTQATASASADRRMSVAPPDIPVPAHKRARFGNPAYGTAEDKETMMEIAGNVLRHISMYSSLPVCLNFMCTLFSHSITSVIYNRRKFGESRQTITPFQ